MKKTWMIAGLSALVLALGTLQAPVMADSHCGECEKKCDKKGGWGLEDKVYHKAHYILDHEEELGLSEDQVAMIKDLKMEVKKTVIRKDAEKELAWLDAKEAMYGYPVDGDRLAELVSKKYEVKKAKAVAIAKAYAKVKNTLTEEQYQTLKDLWHGKK